MDYSGDQMDIDGPSFNAGRRRTFDEFAEGEEVQVDRVHRPLGIQMPNPPPRRFRRYAHPEDFRDDEPDLTWGQILYRGVAVGTVVVAVLTLHMCTTLIQQAARAGRQAFANRANIRQTCTAVVQSRCNAAKRRIVTITGRLPTLSLYRRRPRPSPTRRTSYTQVLEDNPSIREQYIEVLRKECVECTGPPFFPQIMDVDSESSLPYMMTGALPTDPFATVEAKDHDMISDTSLNTSEDEPVIPHSPVYTFAKSHVPIHLSKELNTIHGIRPKSTSGTTELPSGSTANQNSQASDSSFHQSVGRPSSLRFSATPIRTSAQSKPSSSSSRASLASPSTPPSSPKRRVKKSVTFFKSPKTGRPVAGTRKFVSGQPMDFPVSSSPVLAESTLSSIADSLIPVDNLIHHEQATKTDRSSKHTDTATRVDLYHDAAPQIEHHEGLQAPLLTVDANGSPLTSFIASTSPGLQNSLSDTPKKEDVSTPIDCNTSDSGDESDTGPADPPKESASSSEEPTPAPIESLPVAEGHTSDSSDESVTGPADPPEESASSSEEPTPAPNQSLPVAEGDVHLVDHADTIAHEDVTVIVTASSLTADMDRQAESVEIAAVEQSNPVADRQAETSSESDGNSLKLTGTASSGRKGRPSRRRTQSPRKSSRHNRRSARTAQSLSVSLGDLHLASRHKSVRVAEIQEKKAREEQEAVEAAKKLRKEREAEEAARKAKEAEKEEAARKEREAEEERRKQRIRRIPKEKIIQPLDATWEANVQQALDTPNMRQVLVTFSSGVTLTRKDIGTLKVVPGRDPAHGWLNDEIIAACLQQVVDYGLRISDHKAGETPKYHAFNTFFYKNLRDKGAQSVSRWATRAKIDKDDLLTVERVFIPVHQGAHWTLLVVSPLARTIEYFDSMGGNASSYVRNAKLWLAEVLKSGFKEEEWTVPTGSHGAGPRQTNGSDCGVFTCTTARMVVLGVDPMSYGGEDMGVQRGRMVAELLNGGLKGDFEPRVVF